LKLKKLAQKKINLIFGIGLILVILVGVITNFTTQNLIDSIDLVRHSNDVLEETNATLLILQNSKRSTFLNNGTNDYIHEYEKKSVQINANLEKLTQLTQDNPSQQERLTHLKNIFSQKIKNSDDQIQTIFSQILAEERRLLSLRFEKTKLGQGLTVNLLDLGRILSVVFMLAAIFLLNLSINWKSEADLLFEERNKQLQSIVTSIGNAVVAADSNGKIIYFNPAAESVLGNIAAPGPPETWVNHYGSFEVDQVTPFPIEKSALLRGLKGIEVNEAEQFIRNEKRPNGAFLSITGRPIYSESGEILGSVAVLTDITHRKELEKSYSEMNKFLNEKNIELAAVNRELESFSYAVSHDLRAPLRSIIGFSDILIRKNADKLDAEALDFLNRIKDSGNRLGQLIDGLLELSRLTRGELKRESVNLTKTVKDCILELNSMSQNRNIEFVVAENITVIGDERLLRPVIQNLLHNAFKFSSKKEKARIEFGTVLQNDIPVYFIKDNGAGFNMQYASKLFSIFQRLHSVREFDGNGIGLATVQRIISRHGGSIWAEGAPDEGATFYFTI
jgi:signal transduction histidine kinase